MSVSPRSDRVTSQRVRDRIDVATRRRQNLIRQPLYQSIMFTSGVVVVWILCVSIAGQWGRIEANTASAVTMVFGSFVAGSTSQGGGAVAYPVFTKLFEVSAADARTFSLSIQAIGMGSATVVILLTKRAVDLKALRFTIPAAILGYLMGSIALIYFTPLSAYTRIVFTLLVVVVGASTVLSRRNLVVAQLMTSPLRTATSKIAVVVVATIGGGVSALFGSGADVLVYLLLTIVMGVRPDIGVATSVVTMASVSVIGLVVSLVTGALSPEVTVDQTDLFGMWMAAIPLVVVGAPLGSWVASKISSASLAWFIAALASFELVSTVVFVEDLRTDWSVAVFAVVGLVIAAGVVNRLLRLRDAVAVGRSPQSISIRRIDIELGVKP